MEKIKHPRVNRNLGHFGDISMPQKANTHIKHRGMCWKEGEATSFEHQLICEEPLSIRVQGKPYSVVMRTPGDEIQHVAGFCLAEGIVDDPADIKNIAFCDGDDTNVVTVTLTSSRQEKITQILDRRNFISQTSCGICGKEVIKDLCQAVHPLTDNTKVDAEKAIFCLENLAEHQQLYNKTRGTHAAAIFDRDYKILSIAEDIGRHNALDKAIGKLFLENIIKKAFLLVLTSRISYELVQKAARAGIPVITAMSFPTELAVKLSEQLNMTITCHKRNSGFYVFCGQDRL